MVDVSQWSDARLEEAVIQPNTDYPIRGAAKAELTRRQRQQELERDAAREAHENAIFDAQSRNEVHRKNFDERLARENREHAEKIAAQQLAVARQNVWITGLATFAAIMSAVAAIASLVLTLQSK